ncbi:rhamnosyl transferase [Rhizobiales bacterium TNE-4]|nr:rhamnosyl transferase [Rhizobiales bacterium TNE-4]MBV1827566.1 rhamnosyl transferase [Rhizobiales bacterium TNE-4]
MNTTKSSIYAGVVLYFPNEDYTLQQLAIIADQVDKILVFLNYQASSDFIKKVMAEVNNIQILNTTGDNLGLGNAYNIFVDIARSNNCEKLVLFDQDSLPLKDTIKKLCLAMAELETEGFNPVVIGPLPFNYDGKQLSTAPRTEWYSSSGYFEVEFAISSGSLINLNKAQLVGIFRADFFIDCIDIEWCYRARHLGYSIWICPDAKMFHSLGAGVFTFLGIALTDQNPKRFYTFIRNQIILLKLNHVPLVAKIKSATSMPIRIMANLYKERSFAIIHAVFLGLWHGIINKLGRPRDF